MRRVAKQIHEQRQVVLREAVVVFEPLEDYVDSPERKRVRARLRAAGTDP